MFRLLLVWLCNPVFAFLPEYQKLTVSPWWRMWTMPEPKELIRRSALQVDKMNLVSSGCALKSVRILPLMLGYWISFSGLTRNSTLIIYYRLTSEKMLENSHELKMLYSKCWIFFSLRGVSVESVDLFSFYWFWHHTCLFGRSLQILPSMIRTLDKTISNLEMELASAKATQDSILNGAPSPESTGKRKYFMVIGISTAFSSRKRRDSVRATWMPQGSAISCSFHLFKCFPFLCNKNCSASLPRYLVPWPIFVGFTTGEKRRKMEEEKGIIIRFIIGHRLVHKSIYIILTEQYITILRSSNVNPKIASALWHLNLWLCHVWQCHIWRDTR